MSVCPATQTEQKEVPQHLKAAQPQLHTMLRDVDSWPSRAMLNDLDHVNTCNARVPSFTLPPLGLFQPDSLL